MSKQTKRKYTQGFKQEAVKLVTEQGYKVSEAARNLGLSRSMLGRWRQEFDAEKGAERLGEAAREELKRLRSEVKGLRMEREILKKRRPSSPRNRIELSFHRRAEEGLSHCLAVPTHGGEP